VVTAKVVVVIMMRKSLQGKKAIYKVFCIVGEKIYKPFKQKLW